MMNVAIIEYAADIDEALNNFPRESTLYLSVSAEASYHLSRKGIKFLTEDDVLTPEEFKTLGEENFDIAERWIGELEDALHSRNAGPNKIEFRPFEWNFHRIKILLDAVGVRKAIIDRLIKREFPALIAAPAGIDPSEIKDHNLFFYRYDSLYGLIAKDAANTLGISYRAWRAPRCASGAGRSFYEMARDVVRKAAKASAGLIVMGRNIFSGNKDNFLLGTLDYDVEFLRKELSGRFNFYYYRDPFNIVSLNSFLRLNPKKDTDSRAVAIDLSGIAGVTNITGDPIIDKILSGRIQAYAKKFIPLLLGGLEYIESVDKKKNFKAYLHHVGPSDSLNALPVYYFNKVKKPVFLIQHGAYGFSLNKILKYCEFGHELNFLAWGDGIVEMYGKNKKEACRIVSTGSHLLDTIRRDSKPSKKISRICYVPCSFRGYRAYFPNGQPCLDSKLFLMETGFLNAIKPYINRYDVTYKVDPSMAVHSSAFGKTPMIEWVKENLEGVRIESRPLVSVIHDFDLFILDFPSTGLVQTMATYAEVMVYAGNPYHSPSPDVMELLKKRSIVGETETDFKDKIKRTLDKGEFVSNLYNAEFLKKYGTHLNDGKSLKRITGQILDVIYNDASDVRI